MAANDTEAVAWLLEHEERKLTAWELDFLQSLQDGGIRTQRQQDKLDQIWQAVVVRKERDV